MGKYTVVESEYKNGPIIQIFEVLGTTSEGEKITEKFPVIGFGPKKAARIFEALDQDGIQSSIKELIKKYQK